MIGGVKCDADEKRHHRQEDDAGKKIHDLEFTYLIYATLDLAMNKINADTEHKGSEYSNKPKSWISTGRRRDEPADQRDLGHDHYPEPEPEVNELLFKSIELGHSASNVGTPIALTAVGRELR